MEETIDTSSEQSLLDTGADSTNAAPAASSQPAAETPTQPSTGWVNPDGTFGDKWLDALPEDAKDYKDTLAKYKSVPDMAKARQGVHVVYNNCHANYGTSNADEITALLIGFDQERRATLI